MKPSLTETPNYLTQNIDIATPLEIVRLFRQVDAQIFQGYKKYPGFLDPEFQERFQRAVEEITGSFKKNQKVTVVFSGAGTSGRLAAFLAKSFSRVTTHAGEKAPIFTYLMAGGNAALVAAREGAEDDPHQAVQDLKVFEKESDKIIYIGITCGFSAPYIAGQMNYTLNHSLYYSILLGFNPPERARDIRIENWDRSFFDVLSTFEKGKNTNVLNPIIGPEGITGSTRLKGGTATKMVGELLFYLSLLRSNLLSTQNCLDSSLSEQPDLLKEYLHLLDRYEDVKKIVYNKYQTIARFIKIAGKSLNNEGHIYYIGRKNLGNLGIVDASECPPTFGAAFEDVRGFIEGGWPGLLEQDEDLSHVDWMYRISLDDFKKDVFPNLTENDSIFILGERNDEEFIKEQLKKVQASPAQPHIIYLSPTHPPGWNIPSDSLLHISPPFPGLFHGHHFWNEFALKLAINLITTGAHILKGKIYENRMIDLNISNNKLFYRTIYILQTFMGIDYETARQSVLRSIYQTDSPTEDILNMPVSKHIYNANGQEKVVPKALLIATGKFTYKEAEKELKKDPIVRNIVQDFINNND